MNPLATELNEQLAGTVVEQLLSDFGKRFYFPKALAAQAAEARGKATRHDATTGMALDRGGPLMPEAMERLIVPLTRSEAVEYAPGGGVAELRQMWAKEIIRKNPGLKTSTFSHPIAFNLIPQIGSEKHAGYTSEEMKMVWETQKIFNDKSIRVCPTCVRAPVTNCHSESILVETERKLTADEARKLFEEFPGITVLDDLNAGEYPLPLSCSGKDDVFVGRIREDLSCDNGLAFWCVSDNLRKGAATNAVQIAELLATSKAAV